MRHTGAAGGPGTQGRGGRTVGRPGGRGPTRGSRGSTSVGEGPTGRSTPVPDRPGTPHRGPPPSPTGLPWSPRRSSRGRPRSRGGAPSRRRGPGTRPWTGGPRHRRVVLRRGTGRTETGSVGRPSPGPTRVGRHTRARTSRRGGVWLRGGVWTGRPTCTSTTRTRDVGGL